MRDEYEIDWLDTAKNDVNTQFSMFLMTEESENKNLRDGIRNIDALKSLDKAVVNEIADKHNAQQVNLFRHFQSETTKLRESYRDSICEHEDINTHAAGDIRGLQKKLNKQKECFLAAAFITAGLSAIFLPALIADENNFIGPLTNGAFMRAAEICRPQIMETLKPAFEQTAKKHDVPSYALYALSQHMVEPYIEEMATSLSQNCMDDKLSGFRRDMGSVLITGMSVSFSNEPHRGNLVLNIKPELAFN
jgi:hypothetical protein